MNLVANVAISPREILLQQERQVRYIMLISSDNKMHVIFVSHARPSYIKILIFSKEGLACKTMLYYANKEDEAIFSRLQGQSGLR